MPNIHDSPWLPILEESSDGIALAAPHPWQLMYVNSVLATWLGGTAKEHSDRPIDEIFRDAGSLKLTEQLDRVFDGSEPRVSLRQELAPPAGATMRVEIRLRRIVLDKSPLVGMIIRGCESAADVIGRDPLTGLADRSVLLARMAALLRGDRAADLQFAVLFIDLDNFKQVNDAQGHLIGDRVLGEVARRLAGCVRTGDLIVRFGGDEFVALVENVSGLSEIQPVINRIDAALAKPITLADGEVTLSVSVGVAQASAEHRTPEDLLRDADRAMYASKRLPR